MAAITLVNPADGASWSAGARTITFYWRTIKADSAPFYLCIKNGQGAIIWRDPLVPANVKVSEIGDWHLSVPFIWTKDNYSWYVTQSTDTSEIRHFSITSPAVKAGESQLSDWFNMVKRNPEQN